MVFMNFISNNYSLTMLMGVGLWALSERLKNQEGPIARIAQVASLALSTGLVLYSTRRAYNDAATFLGIRNALDLSYKQLTASPDLSHTPALRSLNLGYNRLTAPPDLSSTPALRSLNLRNNRLTASPDLSHTPALKSLDLGYNRLTTSPDLSHTPLLTLLDLSTNQLTAPPDLSRTPALKTLDLSNNRLTASPDLSHTPALTSLNLLGNQLTASPDLSHTPALNTLNLSGNQLTTPPDLSHTYALASLNLEFNQLRFPPDLSHTPLLLSLQLSHNRLTASPDLSHTPALNTLDLSVNQLTAPPDLSHTPALASLELGSNQLTAPPDLSHTPALNTLNLRNNRLTASPDLSHTPALTSLNLLGNRLTASPDLSHTPALKTLSLSDNRLTASPDLSHTPALTSIDLSSNQVTASPDVSHTPLLVSLNLSGNHLTALHDSILHLPRISTVNADGNRFSAEYVAAFQQRLQEHRLQHPGQGPTVLMSIADDHLPADTQNLEQRLREWSDEYEKIEPPTFGDSRPRITDTNAQTYFEPLLSLGEEDKNNLSNYLRRLRETRDYQNGTPDSKKNVILRVERMLRLACENGEFKGQMLALINEGLTTCGDRVLITFNDIEIQWHIHQTQSEPELRNLLVRVERYEQLREHAIQVAEQRQLGDQVETILHYQIALTKQLNLPISTRGMLYQAMSGVTQTMLNDARTKIASLSDEDLLSQSKHWRVYLAKKHAGATSKINEKFGELLAVAEDYYDIYSIDDTETSSKRRSFLETHPNFAQFLKSNPGIINYLSACDFINRQRDAAITALGSESTDKPYIDRKERKERERKVRGEE
jgi:Leucine-rich repeat (LRR) protein